MSTGEVMTSRDTLLVETSLDNVFMFEGFNSFQKVVTKNSWKVRRRTLCEIDFLSQLLIAHSKTFYRFWIRGSRDQKLFQNLVDTLRRNNEYSSAVIVQLQIGQGVSLQSHKGWNSFRHFIALFDEWTNQAKVDIQSVWKNCTISFNWHTN